MSVNTGGPAFPAPNWHANTPIGMTLRDYFAAKALTAFMSDARWVSGLDDQAAKQGVTFKDAMAQHSYQMADALLKARDA